MNLALNRKTGERGSALLIVLVMSAMIAIMLYKEMPVSAFEAQRQKEELLVERGGEYKHAIKLFVRKFGRFPGSLDELESTNRMRFLRRKYVDPLTGKDDWRLLHAGPGGVILDSKIKSTTNTTGASTLGQGATFAGFNNSIKQPDAESDAENATTPGLRQRGPATKNAGAVGAVGDFSPLPTTAGIGNGENLYPGLSADGSAPANPSGPSMANVANGGNAAQSGNQQALTTLANDPQVAAAMAAAGQGIGAGGPGNQALTQQLNTQNPLTPQGAPNQTGTGGVSGVGAFPQNGQQANGQGGLSGGGIAGVASIAAGKSIKEVNDQTKYSLWEFVYDLRKEQQANMPGAMQQQNGAQNGIGAGPNGNNSSTGGFGTSSFGSGSAGQNSNGGSSFGQQTSPVASPTPVPSSPPQ